MTTPTIAEVAGKLSDAQREALTFPLRFAHGERILQRGSRATVEAMARRGLCNGACLTPLGLAVREYLSQPLQGTGE